MRQVKRMSGRLLAWTLPAGAFLLAGCGLLSASCNKTCTMTCVEDDKGPFYTCIEEACGKSQPAVNYKVVDPNKCEPKG